MINSYKHIRVPFNYIHDNIWSSYTQYYRTLLCAQSIHIASILPYTNAYSNNSHSISFRSRYLANIIGKFLYFKLFTFFAFGFGVGSLVASEVQGMSYLFFVGAGVFSVHGFDENDI